MPEAILARTNPDPPAGWSFTSRDEMWEGYKKAVDSGFTAQINRVPVTINGEQVWTYRLTINQPFEDVHVYVDTAENDGSLPTKLVWEHRSFAAYTDDEFTATFTVAG